MKGFNTKILHGSKFQKLLFIAFLIFTAVFSAFIYVLFSNIDLYKNHSRIIVSTLYLDIACVLGVLFLGINQLTHIFSKKKEGSSRLTLKLVSIFSALSVIPSVVMCIFSALFFHNGLDSWFNNRNQIVLKESINIANASLKEHKHHALNDCAMISKSIEYYIDKVEDFHVNMDKHLQVVCHLLDEMCRIRDVNSAILMDSSLHVIAHSRYSVSLHFMNFYYSEVENLKKKKRHTKILHTDNVEIFPVVSFFSGDGEDMYLLIEKKVDKNVFEYAKNAQMAYNDYQQMYKERGSFEIAFIFIFLIVGVLMLIVSVAIAVIYSWKIVHPVSNLVDVAKKIIHGNLSARAKEEKTYAEVQLLTRTFNHMIETMQNQRKDLIRVNQELDEKMKFATSVLAGVSSGVLGTDNGHIYIWNHASEELLGRKILFGEHISNILPVVAELLSDTSNDEIEKEIQYKKDDKIFVFSLKIARISLKKEERAVITFTDLTDILIAQRKVAWNEVARRVAHEIKNPLTPIQLSAERIKRKYLKQITLEADTFVNLTEVIVKQVGDIKRLLDEFNFFARLPEPKLVSCNLCEICSQAIFLMQNVAENVTIQKDFDDNVVINADERLLHQSIVNLIQNAINALSTIEKDDKKIWISIKKQSDKVVLLIEDNGPGLPQEKMESLATPYFTLMPKGTGLGLAIVKKIVQDHKGKLVFENSTHGGAKVSLILPIEGING